MRCSSPGAFALFALTISAATIAIDGCARPARPTPPPASATAEEVALAGGKIVIAVGDIARCDSRGDEATALLVDSLLRANSAAKVEDVVVTMGDNVYDSGTTSEFTQCFAPSWGDPKKEIMKKIRPTPGNHEYRSSGATPYFAYFKDRAGQPGKGYYSFDLGPWHVIALNSEIETNPRFLAADRKAQRDWVIDDLKKHPVRCTLVYMHHPRWSSSYHGDEAEMGSIYQILYENGVDVILTGHDHTYERFAPQSPGGVRDVQRGIVQFVVGTGGADLRSFRRPASNSAARVEGYYGVLKLTLGSEAYQHAFIDTNGRVWDPGAGRCH